MVLNREEAGVLVDSIEVTLGYDAAFFPVSSQHLKSSLGGKA